jgi:hypothetical protein
LDGVERGRVGRSSLDGAERGRAGRSSTRRRRRVGRGRGERGARVKRIVKIKKRGDILTINLLLNSD